jgi:protein-S-isoprenylcysteine O-methyltransferase Ste14
MMNAANICTTLWLVFASVWILAWLRTKATQEKAPLSSRLLYGLPVTVGSYFMFSDAWPWGRGHILPRSSALDWSAVVLTTVGIGFAVWARFYLGQNWSGAVSVKVGHELIRRGPYNWVRHPIYSGLLLALIGTALERDKWIDFAAIALIGLGFCIKSRLEEQFMRKTFGEQYAEYSRQTGALIPKLRL